jgi:hypothetical protein
MSRPKPKVLAEIVNKTTFKSDQILASDGIWAVFFNGKPINLKIVNMISNFPGPKYKKISFSNKGHSINLCKKLNEQFKTDKFTVVLLTQGEKIYP